MPCHQQRVTAVIGMMIALASSFAFSFVMPFVGGRYCSSPRLQHHVLYASESSPTIEQLASDPFMSQVSHASHMVQLLGTKDVSQEELIKQLKTQLSHSDGIRGFFVTYLTLDSDEAPADLDEVPLPLVTAMKESNQEELIPLACMNVVMPTATSSMNTDPALSAASQKTAERGLKVLKSLLKESDAAKDHCKAIYCAAVAKLKENEHHANTLDIFDAERVKYWRLFFEKYEYKEQQLNDIRAIFSELV
jgi:hypothetical protein